MGFLNDVKLWPVKTYYATEPRNNSQHFRERKTNILPTKHIVYIFLHRIRKFSRKQEKKDSITVIAKFCKRSIPIQHLAERILFPRESSSIANFPFQDSNEIIACQIQQRSYLDSCLLETCEISLVNSNYSRKQKNDRLKNSRIPLIENYIAARLSSRFENEENEILLQRIHHILSKLANSSM